MYSSQTTVVASSGDIDAGENRTVIPGREPLARNDAHQATPSGLLDPATRAALAFDAQEMLRAKTWARVLGCLCALTGVLLNLVHGHPEMRMYAQGACFVLAPVCLWVAHRAARPGGYTRMVYRIFGWTAALSSLPVIYFLGVFSPAPLALTLGITFFGLARDPYHAWVIPLVATAGYFAMALAVVIGWLPDVGMLATTVYDGPGRVFMTVMVPLVLLCTLWCAKKTRRTLVSALEQAHRSAYDAEAREVQLLEVNREFEAVRRYGRGKRGRFTGEMAGPFRLDSVVGRGAMGEVYAGFHRDTRMQVAVKVLSDTDGCDSSNLARFLREGDMLRAVKNKNVVQIFQVGRLAGSKPSHFIAMEFLEGQNLAGVLRQNGVMSVQELSACLAGIATGLESVHRAGIVHRDLKPQNLFYSTLHGEKCWKLLDFGVSKFAGSEGTLTQNQLVGTPAFMSPEQARSLDTDARSDVFSLGAIAFRALTGRPPFTAPQMPGVLYKIVYEHPPMPSSCVHGIPLDIERVLAVALCKNPVNRFQSAEQFRDAWVEAAQGNLRNGFRVRGDALMQVYAWKKAN